MTFRKIVFILPCGLELEPGNIVLTNDYAYQVYLDEFNVGTPEYKGFTFFWNYEYRHFCRDMSRERRRLLHDELIEKGLELDGDSNEITNIVVKHSAKYHGVNSFVTLGGALVISKFV